MTRLLAFFFALRGGSWYDRPAYARASNRFGNVPSERDGVFGVRCARGSR